MFLRNPRRIRLCFAEKYPRNRVIFLYIPVLRYPSYRRRALISRKVGISHKLEHVSQEHVPDSKVRPCSIGPVIKYSFYTSRNRDISHF